MTKSKTALQFAIVAACTIALMVLAPSLSFYLVHVLILIFYFAYLSTSWDILGGTTGQLSFGHSLFIGLGAYTSTIFFLKFSITPWIGMIAGALVATLIALFLGYLSFRYGLRGFYFGLMTIVFSEVTRYIILNVEWLGAARGLYISYAGNLPGIMQFQAKHHYFYTILLMYVVLIFVYWMISNSRLGYYLIAIRESQDTAAAIGINPFKYKMIAISISGFATALAGSFYAQYTTFIDPYSMFTFALSIQLVVFSVAGGIGTIFGPLFGAMILIPVGEVLRGTIGNNWPGVHLAIYGLILLLVIRFMPDGILPWIKRVLQILNKRQEARRYDSASSKSTT